MDYDKIKRVMDIAISTAALILFSPFLLLVAAAIKITSPGPVFVEVSSPRRVGRNGSLFRLYKFRSMIPGAYYAIRNNPQYKELLKRYKRGGYKLQDDPRVTPVGRFIRKYSIDEFPQFINVLRGEMSVVGPRPYYAEELEQQQGTYPATRRLVKEALSVKPGITGFWQVSGRSEINFDKRIAMDAYYARSRSFWLDLSILAKTPWAVLRGKGAV